jgi:hypothetical protein
MVHFPPLKKRIFESRGDSKSVSGRVSTNGGAKLPASFALNRNLLARLQFRASALEKFAFIG